MSDLFAPYFKAIKELDVSEATEHTLRGPLENLLKFLATRADSNIAVIHDPKRDANRLGAPDFKFKVHEAILGYLENKKIDESLDSVLQSTQIAKYKRLSNNIVVTNHLEWVWLQNGYIAKRETLCQRSDVGRRRARLDPDKAEKVAGLIGGFLSALPQKLGDAKKLAAALAMRCHIPFWTTPLFGACGTPCCKPLISYTFSTCTAIREKKSNHQRGRKTRTYSTSSRAWQSL